MTAWGEPERVLLKTRVYVSGWAKLSASGSGKRGHKRLRQRTEWGLGQGSAAGRATLHTLGCGA